MSVHALNARMLQQFNAVTRLRMTFFAAFQFSVNSQTDHSLLSASVQLSVVQSHVVSTSVPGHLNARSTTPAIVLDSE